jgi:hypothetical protein
LDYRGKFDDIPPHLRTYHVPDDEAWWEEGYNANSDISPKQLWELASAYFHFQTSRPVQVREIKTLSGGSGEGSYLADVDLPKARPFSWSGFLVYSGLTRSELKSMGKSDPKMKKIVDRIEAVMWAQKFENAASGTMNANLIARELQLSEKIETDNHHSGEIKITETVIDPQHEDPEGE